MHAFRLVGILSPFTLKVFGQFAFADKGDAGGEDKGKLESEKVCSSGMHVDIVRQKWIQALEWGEYYIMDQYLVTSVTHYCWMLFHF